MTDTRRHNTAERLATAAPAAGTGFTLIEVLVVIFILGILAAMVVSVAGYVMTSASRRETESTQKVLLEAVQAFYDTGTPKAYPPDRYDPNDPNADPNSGRVLVGCITGGGSLQTTPVKAATELLLKLPREAWDGAQDPVLDGWRIPMRYEAAGGLGGRPVIISAGPDRKFGNNDTAEEDNIRSDESQ